MVRTWQKSAAWLVALSISSAAFAADGPPPPQPIAPPAAAAPAKVLTIEELGQLLEKAGFKVTPSKNDKGIVDSYIARLDFAGYSSTFTFMLSQSGNYVWFNVGLTTVDLKNVPADALAKLLKNNANSGTTFFYIDANNTVCFWSVWSVDGLTPEKLKSEIESAEGQVVSTVGLWGDLPGPKPDKKT